MMGLITQQSKSIQAIEYTLKHDVAMKSDLEKYATKKDLERFATKEDLKKFATKEDLKNELKKYATKEDLMSVSSTFLEALNTSFRKLQKENGVSNKRLDGFEKRLARLEKRLA